MISPVFSTLYDGQAWSGGQREVWRQKKGETIPKTLHFSHIRATIIEKSRDTIHRARRCPMLAGHSRASPKLWFHAKCYSHLLDRGLWRKTHTRIKRKSFEGGICSTGPPPSQVTITMTFNIVIVIVNRPFTITITITMTFGPHLGANRVMLRRLILALLLDNYHGNWRIWNSGFMSPFAYWLPWSRPIQMLLCQYRLRNLNKGR